MHEYANKYRSLLCMPPLFLVWLVQTNHKNFTDKLAQSEISRPSVHSLPVSKWEMEGEIY